MPKQDEFPALLAALKSVVAPYVPRLVVKADTPENYSLDAPPSAAYPKGLFFGAVQIKKSYVAYHLMPVYVFPDLLDGLPDALRRRMQGKSCFNFPSLAALDPETAAALERLTAAGFERFARERLVDRQDAP